MKFAYITTSEIKIIRIVSTNIDVLYHALEKEQQRNKYKQNMKKIKPNIKNF